MLNLVLLITLAVSFTLGDLYPTLPDGDTVWSVGSKVKIAWRDGEAPPKLASLKPFKIELCTGTDSKQLVLQTISNQTASSVQEIDYIVPDVSPYGRIYFLKFTAPNPRRKSDPFYYWTTRFTITDTDDTSPSPSAIGTGALATSKRVKKSSAKPTKKLSSKPTSSEPPKSLATNISPASVVDTEIHSTPSMSSNGKKITCLIALPIIFVVSLVCVA